MKRAKTKGFTLIEIMIAVAILGILSAIALPVYNGYIAKSKFSAALSEIAAGKVKADVLINDGTLNISQPTDLGLSPLTEHCSISVTINAGIGVMDCTIQQGPSEIVGKIIYLHRKADNSWECKTDASNDYSGTSCEGV